MKKKIALIGAAISLLGLYQVNKYLLNYKNLTQYGKGYVLGSFLLLIIGIFLMIYGIRKKKISE
jgi:hypothetical protein